MYQDHSLHAAYGIPVVQCKQTHKEALATFWKQRQPDPIEIPYEEETDLIHTPEHPFCGDPTCGCADDPILIGEIAERVASGELTPDQATDIVRGKGW